MAVSNGNDSQLFFGGTQFDDVDDVSGANLFVYTDTKYTKIQTNDEKRKMCISLALMSFGWNNLAFNLVFSHCDKGDGDDDRGGQMRMKI